MKRSGRKPQLEQRSSIENPTVPVSAENFMTFFGQGSLDLPSVTIDKALMVPAIAAAVAFLSRTLATVPLHVFRATDQGPKKLTGKLQTVIHSFPNDQMDTFKFRQYFWQQVFTGGRGLAWIERSGSNIEAIWAMNPAKVTIRRAPGPKNELIYSCDGQDYPATEIIDVPFMLRANQTGHYAPIKLATKVIQLALSMNDYASGFFAGGGVPPLAMTGPIPAGPEGLKRAMGDISRAIDGAKASNKPVFPLPPGYSLQPVGIDPEKGQMTTARRFQVEEVARVWQLPPVFLQELTNAKFANVEQQDLHLVKHLVAQWAKAFEGEVNLKIFGRASSGRYVEHNLDGIMRGDFKSRIEGLARAIQTAQITPNEARNIENRPAHPNEAADQLLIQGATVVLGTTSTPPAPEPPAEGDPPPESEDDNASDTKD